MSVPHVTLGQYREDSSIRYVSTRRGIAQIAAYALSVPDTNRRARVGSKASVPGDSHSIVYMRPLLYPVGVVAISNRRCVWIFFRLLLRDGLARVSTSALAAALLLLLRCCAAAPEGAKQEAMPRLQCELSREKRIACAHMRVQHAQVRTYRTKKKTAQSKSGAQSIESCGARPVRQRRPPVARELLEAMLLLHPDGFGPRVSTGTPRSECAVRSAQDATSRQDRRP
eukprot:2243028-Rhodomonas_salina.1